MELFCYSTVTDRAPLRPMMSSKYFNSTANTVIYVHGWFDRACPSDLSQMNPFVLYNADGSVSHNLNIEAWHRQQWNVCAFHWPKYACRSGLSSLAEIQVK